MQSRQRGPAAQPALGALTSFSLVLYTVLTVEGNWACSLRMKASISRWMLAFSGALVSRAGVQTEGTANRRL